MITFCWFEGGFCLVSRRYRKSIQRFKPVTILTFRLNVLIEKNTPKVSVATSNHTLWPASIINKEYWKDSPAVVRIWYCQILPVRDSMFLDLAGSFKAIRARRKNQLGVQNLLSEAEPSCVVRGPNQRPEIVTLKNCTSNGLVANARRWVEQPTKPRPSPPSASSPMWGWTSSRRAFYSGKQ